MKREMENINVLDKCQIAKCKTLILDIKLFKPKDLLPLRKLSYKRARDITLIVTLVVTPMSALNRLTGLLKLGLPRPLYYDTLRANPPLSFTTTSTSARSTKPRKLVFPEDRLRARYYRDHPFELDTPIRASQPDDAEFLIQRQLQLMAQERLSLDEAYERAGDELKRRRVEGEIGRRLAGAAGGEQELRASELLDEVLLEEKRMLQLQQEKRATAIVKHNRK